MKRFLSLFLVFATLCNMVAFAAPQMAGTVETVSEVSDDDELSESALEDKEAELNAESDFEYFISNGEATIVSYSGSSNSVTIPSKLGGYPVTSIQEVAFYMCSTITDITIPEGVTFIGCDAFYGCNNLKSITIPKSMTTICGGAFRYLPLENVYYNGSVYEWNNNIIIGRWNDDLFDAEIVCKDGSVVNDTHNLEYGDFTYCLSKGEAIIIGGDRYIYGNVVIPSTIDGYPVTGIFGHAFKACCDMTSVKIPENVTSIGNGAFSNCLSLETVYIPKSVESIGDEVFYYCSNLRDITVDVANPYYCIDENGVLFDKNKTTLIVHPINKSSTRYIIPEGVTRIEGKAFYGCSNLESITIPDSVTYIGLAAFTDCEGLKSISIPNGVTSISSWTFRYCTNLESVTIGKGVTVIGSDAFANCNSLSTVYYNGTRSKWNKIKVNTGNAPLLNAELFFNNEPDDDPKSTYTVTYNANGGTGAPAEQEKKQGVALKLSKTKPTRSGFTFEGWSSSANATSAEYEAGDSYKKDEDIVLYAVWKQKEVAVKKVTLNKTKLALIVGDTVELIAAVSPVDATDKNITWSSSNEEIATVDENGVVTAHKSGTVKITASSANKKKATCTVTIGAPADTVEFSSVKSTSLAVGKTLTLKAKAFCEDGSKPVSTDVKYEIVSGSNYATIDAKGKLKGVAVGEVTVRATAVAGTDSAYKYITINVCIPATKIKLDTTKVSMVVGGEDAELVAVMSPENNTDTLTWSSANEEIATVDENGVITAHKAGTVKITALTGSGKKATCTVTVGVAADKVEFSLIKNTSLAVGKSLTLKAKASRVDGAKPVSTAVTYEIVEGHEFATIDDKGRLKGVKSGEVVVRATAVAAIGEVYDEVTIKVCVPITKIKFSQSKITLTEGDVVECPELEINPEDHTDTWTYSSSKNSVVTVDEDGTITAVAKGSAKVYAISGSGKKATLSIKVVSE